MRHGVQNLRACILFVGISVFLCVTSAGVQAQQSTEANFLQNYETAVTKARAECAALFSDHAFDPLRKLVPLGEEKPTFSMLTNNERLQSKDKPLAELAIKTLEKCRSAYAPVYAMLPPQISNMIHGVERRQDANIAELYRGKTTFGEYNVAMNRLNGELSEAVSGMSNTSQSATAVVTKLPLPTSRPQSEPHSVAPINLPTQIRVALVIGNSNYLNLRKLSNPTDDARSVAEALTKMGYHTELVLNASEENIRREVRKFANESDKADVAVVFYAGHGAQVNGSNYLLPVDIDIPRTEADLQFTGLKVDDLVNSIRSNTKIVFLDACRDNPVLYKNLVTGRGSSPTGLAPASASNFEQKPGGGVFIAYATDAGAVADDGSGKHSPFTQALLRNIQKPISIDDMFSLVTKEVRLVTKNAQRPYKYASLENIICVAPNCSNYATPTTSDVIQQAKQSESDELQIALQTNNLAALGTYLKEYPDTPKRATIQSVIEKLKRSEFTEWTLYEVGNKTLPWYFKSSSIQQFADRVAVRTKALINPASSKVFFGKSLPDANSYEDTLVYDCTNPLSITSDETILNKANKVLYHYNFGAPQYLEISRGQAIPPGSVSFTARKILCDPELRTPTVGKEQLAKMDFKSLSSTVAGDGDIFYEPLHNNADNQNEKNFLFILKFFTDHAVPLGSGTSIPDPPNYRTEIDKIRMMCAEKKMISIKNEYYDASNKFVYLLAIGPPTPKANWTQINTELNSPLSTLHRIFCGEEFGGIGVQIAIEDGTVKVSKVIEGTPAARAGIKAEDIITDVDNQSLAGVALEQVVQKLRGPASSKVSLKIMRKGQKGPLELVVGREIIRSQSAQEKATK
jgi:hypothetical protein